jgi:hypothetical protein
MKSVFESETELGRCDTDRIDVPFGEWLAFAHTSATLTGPRGLLKVEQRCYVRSARDPDDIRPQSWVKPQMTLEPVLGSEEDTVRLVEALHHQYVRTAQSEFMEASVVVVPSLAA